jgi:hypothetical protein
MSWFMEEDGKAGIYQSETATVKQRSLAGF